MKKQRVISKAEYLFACVGILGLIAVLAGCGAVKETFPARSALEQLLISTAADRAVEGLPTEWINGKTIHLDVTNLDSYDKPYLVQRIRQMVFQSGGRIADDPKDADAVLEVASGALSINKRHYLFGLPSLPLPIPFGGDTLKTPELPILKAIFYRGKAKLLVSSVDPETKGQLVEIPISFGNSSAAFWWILGFGPIERSDLPGGPQ